MKAPKLRFKDECGNNYQEWHEKKLIDVAPLQRGFDLPKQSMKEGQYPVVGSNGVIGYHNKFISLAPGIITGRSGTIGNLTFIEHAGYWPHNTSLWVTDFKGNNPKFIYYLFQKLDFSKYATGTGVPTLNRNDLHHLLINIPDLEEQRKIADFLSIIDIQRKNIEKELDLVVKIKKGLLQKIFTQQIRIKDKNKHYYPNWMTMNLSEVACFVSERGNSLESCFVGTENMQKGGGVQFNDSVLTHCGILYKKDDILISNIRPYLKKIWKADRTGTCSADVLVIRANNKILSDFLYCALNSDVFFDYVSKNVKGTKMPRGDKKSILNYAIPIPCLTEQAKIANFFKEIDLYVNNINKKLGSLEQIKKYFLQQMFI